MLNYMNSKLEKLWFRNPKFLSSRDCLWSAHFKPIVHENAIKETLYLLFKEFVCCITDVFLPLPHAFTFSKISLFSCAKNHNNIMTFVSFHKASFLVEKKLILSMSCKKDIICYYYSGHTHTKAQTTQNACSQFFPSKQRHFCSLFR